MKFTPMPERLAQEIERNEKEARAVQEKKREGCVMLFGDAHLGDTQQRCVSHILS